MIAEGADNIKDVPARGKHGPSFLAAVVWRRDVLQTLRRGFIFFFTFSTCLHRNVIWTSAAADSGPFFFFFLENG